IRNDADSEKKESMIKRIFLTLALLFFYSSTVKADAIRLCSQNLYRVDGSKTDPQEMGRVNRLAKRIINTNCDIVAAQEIAGKDRAQVERSAELFRQALEAKGEKRWQAVIGDSRDRYISNGFFINRAIGSVVSFQSLSRTV